MKSSEINKKISLSEKWLYSTFIEKNNEYGWSTFKGRNVISEWGGTIDAIRSLLISGESEYNPEISKSLNWLKGKQQADGGWGTWEITNSITESTSWALLTFQETKDFCRDNKILKGYDFIINSHNGDGGWGSFKSDKSRVYSTLLAVWTLSRYHKEMALKGSIWLIDAVNDDGGWGFYPKSQNSNSAMTSLVLYVLIKNNYFIDNKMKDDAVNWLLNNRRSNNLWHPITEEWNSCIDEAKGDEFPCRTHYFTSSWAIIALLEANVPLYDKRLHKSLLAFINSQNKEGSWTFLEYDTKKYTWIVSNGLYALNKIKQCLLVSSLPSDLDLFQIVKSNKLVRYFLIIFIFNFLAIIALLEYNFKIFSGIGSWFINIFYSLFSKIHDIFYFDKIEAGQILVGLLVTIIGGVVLHKYQKNKNLDEKS